MKRDENVEKYKKSIQFIIDGWAAIRTAAMMSDGSGKIGSNVEYNAAIKEFLMSNPELHLTDFGYMYVLMKKKGWPDEIIEDISHYFERGDSLETLYKAYQVRG